MKKLLISFALFTLFFGVKAQTNVITTNPIGLAFGNFNANYEKVLNSSSSLVFRGSYMYSLFGTEVSLGGLGFGYRYYFTHAKKEVPGGFYVNPLATYAVGSVKGDDNSRTGISTFALGAEIGYQWVWQSGFALNLGLGPMYTFVSGFNNNQNTNLANGFVPGMTLAIGYAF